VLHILPADVFVLDDADLLYPGFLLHQPPLPPARRRIDRPAFV
jgi:hypothetical protein